MCLKKQLKTLAALGLLVLPGLASASLIHDLDVTGIFGGFTGSGQIAFTTYAGHDVSGIDTFEFIGQGPMGAFSFTRSHIDNVIWSIDTSSFELTLNLGTSFDGTPTSTDFASCVILQNDGAGGHCAGLTTTVPFSRVAQVRIGRTSTGGGNLLTRAVPLQASTPGTLLLVLAGGLGAMVLNRRRPI